MVRFSRLRYIVLTSPFPAYRTVGIIKSSPTRSYIWSIVISLNLVNWIGHLYFCLKNKLMWAQLTVKCFLLSIKYNWAHINLFFKQLQIQKNIYLFTLRLNDPAVLLQFNSVVCNVNFFVKIGFNFLCYAIKLKVLKQILNIKLFSCTSRNAPNCCGNCNALLQLDCGQQ